MTRTTAGFLKRVAVLVPAAATALLLASPAKAATVCTGNCVFGTNLAVGGGTAGLGSLWLDGGDSLVVPGNTGIGSSGPSKGLLSLAGANTRLASGGSSGSTFWVGGGGGTGQVDIFSGALLSVDAFNNGSNFGDARLWLGRGGNGQVNIYAGAQMLVQDQGGWGLDDDVMVGRSDGTLDGNGRMLVQGGQFTLRGNAAYFNVGNANLTFAGTGRGSGELLVQQGGRLLVDGTSSEGGLHIGRGDNSAGVAVVEGAGSRLDLRGAYASAWVANAFSATTHAGTGSGSLWVRDQGVVSLQSTQTGGASLVVGYGLGSGTVRVDTGGRIEVSGVVRVSSPLGSDRLQNGELIINDSGVVVAQSTLVGDGNAARISGVLSGTGTLESPLTVRAGGAVRPGRSPGTLTVRGPASFAGGLLQIEIGGTAAGLHDLLRVEGALSFAAGSRVEFIFVDGYLPQAGDSLDFAQAPAISGLELATYTYSGAADGFEFALGTSDGALRFVALNNAAAVPEPASAWLMLLGGAAWFGKRRTRSQPA